MPQPKKITTADQNASKLEKPDIIFDPKKVELARKSILAKEQGPNVQQQASFVDWNKLSEVLGQPFDAELIPYSKLRQMRRDPMIGFGLHYIKTPLVRAPWRINAVDDKGPNAQVAAFIEAALRPIYARLIFQYCLSLDFGFSAIVKNFKLENPGGTYVDPNNPGGEEQPVWNEGKILPVVWKHFVALPPEKAAPAWDKPGNFNGIFFDSGDGNAGGTQGGTPGAIDSPQAQGGGAGAGGGGGGAGKKPDIDVFHSLWATNEKDSVFGSLYGYPRIAYAYRYWWSYWYRWALADRAFERQAIPPLVAYYPEGLFEDEDGVAFDNIDSALSAAARVRSNGTIALPSDVHTDMEGKISGMREWELKFLDGGQPNFDFDQVFGTLDVMKLRALFVPEQAFLEGSGGTSSRNVAAQMAEIFIQSQSNLMAEIDDHINRYVIPQLVVVNFPEFLGKVTKVTTGFSSEDVEFMKQIIQLVGQDDPSRLGVDVPTAMQRLGMPMMSPQQQAAEEQRIIEQSAATAPAAVEPGPGTVGVVPNPDSLTGFSYIQPREVIYLSDEGDPDDFVTNLPDSAHFKAPANKQKAKQIQKLMRARYRAQYTGFAEHLEQQIIELADEDETKPVIITAETATKAARKLVKDWFKAAAQGGVAILEGAGAATKAAIAAVFALSGRQMLKSLKSDKEFTSEEIEDWADKKVNKTFKLIDTTTQDELIDFVAKRIVEGKGAPEIAREIREHYESFPEWKANRVARAEVRDAHNIATVTAAKKSGVRYMQAHDALMGPTDEDCELRDGKLFTPTEALKEAKAESVHPNCTLYFTPVERADFSYQYTTDALPNGAKLFFDDEESTLYIQSGMPRAKEARYLKQMIEAIGSEEE